MFSKIRNAVSNMVISGWEQVAVGREVDADGGSSASGSVSGPSLSSSSPPSVSGSRAGRRGSGGGGGGGGGGGPGPGPGSGSGSGSGDRRVKFPYSRPEFLLLGSEDEVQVAGDHQVRPIIVPRDISKLPWNSGYAEAVNAGKSSRNEDQASFHVGHLHRDNGRVVRQIDEWAGTRQDELQENMFVQSLPYYYLAVFDGHAGSGAAVVASRQLHHILHAKLVDVIDHLLPPLVKDSDLRHELHSVSHGNARALDAKVSSSGAAGRSFWISTDKPPDVDKLVVGALESAFWDMDQVIGEDRAKYRINGGCTALVALFVLGKLYVANAGDSRGVLVTCAGRAVPMSRDFTPESERGRVQKVASARPELLGAEYTHLDYYRRPFRRDVGQRVLYRDAHMTGWAYKTVTAEDLKFPVVYGEGKRSRVLATIGVTRGFGDHDLKAQNSKLNVKPFLTPEPEVTTLDLARVRNGDGDGDGDGEGDRETEREVTDNDVLVLGTDGLWDITSNERAAQIVVKNLTQFPTEDQTRFRYRYTSAAQDLVMNSRGKLTERNWRLADGSPATIDDITAFVIPLAPYLREHRKWVDEDGALREFFDAWKADVVRRVSTGAASSSSSASASSSNTTATTTTTTLLTRLTGVRPASLSVTKKGSELGVAATAAATGSPPTSPEIPTGGLAILENGFDHEAEEDGEEEAAAPSEALEGGAEVAADGPVPADDASPPLPPSAAAAAAVPVPGESSPHPDRDERN